MRVESRSVAEGHSGQTIERLVRPPKRSGFSRPRSRAFRTSSNALLRRFPAPILLLRSAEGHLMSFADLHERPKYRSSHVGLRKTSKKNHRATWPILKSIESHNVTRGKNCKNYKRMFGPGQ